MAVRCLIRESGTEQRQASQRVQCAGEVSSLRSEAAGGAQQSSVRHTRHCVKNRPRGRILIFLGADHQVIEVHTAPVLIEVLVQIFGALPVYSADALLDVRAWFQACLEAMNAITKRGVNKDVIGLRLVAQDALRTAAHDDAIAGLVCLLDNFLDQIGHGMGVEDLVFADGLAGGHGHTTHGFFIDAAQPGGDVLVVAANDFGIYVRRLGDGADDLIVEQLPAQPVRDGAGDASTAASKFTGDCQCPVLHFCLRHDPTPLRKEPNTGIYSGPHTMRAWRLMFWETALLVRWSFYAKDSVKADVH
jgi:hypothetical protein